jgi:hypothetical protein
MLLQYKITELVVPAVFIYLINLLRIEHVVGGGGTEIGGLTEEILPFD